MTSTARNESGSGATVTPLVAGTDIERLEKRAEQYLRRSKRTPTDHTHVCFGSMLSKKAIRQVALVWGAAFRLFGRASEPDRRTPRPTCKASYAIDAHTPPVGAAVATAPFGYYGGGPYYGGGLYAGAGAYYAGSPWGDYECRLPHAYDCRPHASKDWGYH